MDLPKEAKRAPSARFEIRVFLPLIKLNGGLREEEEEGAGFDRHIGRDRSTLPIAHITVNPNCHNTWDGKGQKVKVIQGRR